MQRDETYKKRDNQKTSRGKDKKYIDAKEDPQEYRHYDFSQDDMEEDENGECLNESLECDKKAEDSGVDTDKDGSQKKPIRDDLYRYHELLQALINGRLSLKADMRSYEPEEFKTKQKIIYVEGSTDEEFYGGYVKSGVSVENIGIIKNEYKSLTGADIHNNDAVRDLIKALTCGERHGIEMDSRIAEYFDIYGIIDKDFEEDDKYIFLDKLFVTDTHDLETLMLSTDTDVVYHLKNCKITKDDYDKALFKAYQLGEIQHMLRGHKDLRRQAYYLSVRQLNEGLKDCEPKLRIKFLTARNELRSNIRIKLSTVVGIIACFVEKKYKKVGAVKKCLKDKFDDDNIWKMSLEEFCNHLPSQLWNISNGHDIVDVLKLMEFEIKERDLIKAYDHDKFYTTTIAKRMQKACLI